MKYIYAGEFVEGIFIKRINRFVAEVEIEGKNHLVHIKNTGRMKELLVKGEKCYLQKAKNPNRKTKYDLISIHHKDRIVNLDSQIPNIIIKKAIEKNKIKDLENPDSLKSEVSIGNSRLDLMVEKNNKKTYIEIKAVDLMVEKNIASFPGAPTERGRRHLKDLKKIVEKGHRAMIIFFIVREEAKFFRPCYEIDSEFSKIFYEVLDFGVDARAYKTKIGYNWIDLKEEIPILDKTEIQNIKLKKE